MPHLKFHWRILSLSPLNRRLPSDLLWSLVHPSLPFSLSKLFNLPLLLIKVWSLWTELHTNHSWKERLNSQLRSILNSLSLFCMSFAGHAFHVTSSPFISSIDSNEGERQWQRKSLEQDSRTTFGPNSGTGGEFPSSISSSSSFSFVFAEQGIHVYSIAMQVYVSYCEFITMSLSVWFLILSIPKKWFLLFLHFIWFAFCLPRDASLLNLWGRDRLWGWLLSWKSSATDLTFLTLISSWISFLVSSLFLGSLRKKKTIE
jgi:hypothetical protein